jgi:hypothetical protein
MAMMAMTTSNSISVKTPAGFRSLNRLKFEIIFVFIICLFKLHALPDQGLSLGGNAAQDRGRQTTWQMPFGLTTPQSGGCG